MRSITIAIAGAAATCAAVVGCSKDREAREPTAAEVRPGAAYESGPDESVFGEAWDAIQEAGDEVVDAGEWTLEKAEDGAIIVWRRTQEVAGKIGEETDDAAVLTAVKSRIAAEGLDADDVDVDVDEGEVVLRGRVSSRAEAAKLVRVALNTRGVDRVVSYLTWS